MSAPTLEPRSDRPVVLTIAVLSVAIPLAVALLLFIPQTGKLGALDVSFLPHLNAALNSATAVLLLVGLYFIKNRRIPAHRAAMVAAFALSSVFLVSYVLYHFQAPSTRYGDLDHNGVLSAAELAQAGSLRLGYFVLLITHIFLAAIIVPFVLFSIYYGWTGQVQKHRRISRWTWPMWFYVAVSGVVVYLLIRPYYPHA